MSSSACDCNVPMAAFSKKSLTCASCSLPVLPGLPERPSVSGISPCSQNRRGYSLGVLTGNNQGADMPVVAQLSAEREKRRNRKHARTRVRPRAEVREHPGADAPRLARFLLSCFRVPLPTLIPVFGLILVFFQ